MQINRRDYIEFQLEESSSSSVTGGGGGVGAGVADDKLDYRVTMAIEKNTQLLAQYTLQQQQRKNQNAKPSSTNSSSNPFPLELKQLTKSTNLQESFLLPQFKAQTTLGRQQLHQLNGLSPAANNAPLKDQLSYPGVGLPYHLPPLLETETRHTTTTTFSDKRLKLAYELKQYNNTTSDHRQDIDRGGGAATIPEEYQRSKTKLVGNYQKKKEVNNKENRKSVSPPSPAKEACTIKANDYYWQQESTSHFQLDVDHYRRRLLRFSNTGTSLPRKRQEVDFSNLYGTFNEQQQRHAGRPPIVTMMERDYYRLANRSCEEQLHEVAEELLAEHKEQEHAKLVHRMLMMTGGGADAALPPLPLAPNERYLLSNYNQQAFPPCYEQAEQQLKRFSLDEDKMTKNGHVRPLAPLAAIDQEQEFEPKYYQHPQRGDEMQRKEWRKSEGGLCGPQLMMFRPENTENHQYGQLSSMLPDSGAAGVATGPTLTQGIRVGGAGGEPQLGNGDGALMSPRTNGPGKLFNRSAHYTQIVAALAISLGPIAAGLAKGYASPAIDSLQEYSPRKNGTKNGSFYVSDQSASWLASLSLLGALFGGMFGGLAMQFGRKRVLAVMSLPFSMFWVLTVFAQSVETMFLTAFFAGFCVSIISMVTQVYVSEIASPDIRGFLSAIQKVAGHVGFLLSFSLGAYLDWRQLAMLVAVAPIMLFLTVIYIPETPSYLVLKGRDEEAYTALQFLRGPNSNVDVELQTIRSNIRVIKGMSGPDANSSPLSTRKNRFKLHGFTVTSGRDCLIVLGNSIKSLGDRIKAGLRNARLIRPILITCGLMVFQRFTGPNSFNFYAVKIFRQTFAGMNPHGGAVAVGFVQLLASMLSGLLIDTVGRIPLLIISTVFMSLAFACLGSYIYYEQGAKIAATNAMDFEALSEASYNDWIPLLCVLIFMVAFSLGISPISSLLVGELFPLEYRAMGSSIATSFSFFCSFLSVKTFVDFQEKLGLHGVFWLYSGISCIGLIFVVTCVPETKGKDLDEMHPKFVQTINNR